MPENRSAAGGRHVSGVLGRARALLGGIVDRREYLKLTGVAGAAATAIGTADGATGYDHVSVPAGDTYRCVLGDEETLEDVLVDCRAAGAGVEIVARGRDWTIRNVGVRGRNDVEGTGALTVAVREGSGLIGNVYLGDGGADGGTAGVAVAPEHAGELMIQRATVSGWDGGGIDADPVDPQRGGGIVRVDGCHLRNNSGAGVRLGTDGSYLRGSVVHVDSASGSGTGPVDGVRVGRGSVVTIERCDLLLDGPSAGYCVIERGDEESGVARVLDSAVAARNGAVGRFSGYVLTENVDDTPDVTSKAPRRAKDAL